MVTLCVCVFIICTCFWKSSFEEHHFNWWDFPGDSDGKESACNVGDLGSLCGSGGSPGRRAWQPTPYSCLENPHGQRSLVGYSPWGHKELDMTERLSTKKHTFISGI